MTSPRTLVVIALLLSFVVAGALTLGFRSNPTATERWSKQACAATTAWAAAREADPVDIVNAMRTSSGPEEARTLALGFVDRAQARAVQLGTALAAPGAPERPRHVAEELAERTAALGTARSRIEKADTANLAAFAGALSEAVLDASSGESMQAYVACPAKL